MRCGASARPPSPRPWAYRSSASLALPHSAFAAAGPATDGRDGGPTDAQAVSTGP